VWDAVTGRSITPPLKHNNNVYDVAFSPDGRRIVTASNDRTARVWDAGTGRPVTPPLKHNGSVYGVDHAEFSPDGRRVLTASGEGARVWDATTGQPITPRLKHSAQGAEHAAFSADGRRVLSSHWDGTAGVWDLPTDPRPAADLRRLAECLAGSRIDARAGSVPLEPAVARREEQALRAKYPADFAASPAQVQVWHEQEAADAEAALAWSAALPHLDALLAAHPAQAGLRARRATVHAELGHWEQAALDFRQASEQEPDNARLWSFHALAQLAGGDTSDYQRSCVAMLVRFGRSENPNEAYLVALTCVAAPDAVTDTAPLVALAERVKVGRTGWVGAALYRAGRMGEAVQRLTEPGAAQQSVGPVGWLFLAMAHARLGHPAEAQQWLAQATAWMDERLTRDPQSLGWELRVLLRHLRREAEALIPPAGP
jgi:tetratricopeptide (TPR) repeat protein